MEKFARYYLYAESAVLLGILFSGLYDPSFWFYGIFFVGIIVSLGGLVVGVAWCLKKNKLGRSMTVPIAASLFNLALLVFMFMWLQHIFSGGINFWM